MSKIKNITYILFAVAILGILHITDLRSGKEILTGWILLAFVSMLIKNIWIRLMLMWILLRTIMSFNGAIYWISFSYLITVLIYSLAYEVFVWKLNVDKILNTICIIGIAQSLIMYLQFCGIWFVFNNLTIPSKFICNGWLYISMPFQYRSGVGLTDNTNMAGSLLALCLPAFFRKDWAYFIPLIFMGLIISNCLGGLLPAVIISIIFVARKRRYLLWSIPMILISGLFIPNEGTKYRLDLWHDILTNIHHWVIGNGLGSLRIVSLHIESFAHNEYIQALYEGGLIFLALIIGFIISTFIKLWKIRASKYSLILLLGVVVTIINSSVNFLFHTPYCLIAIVYLAMVEKLTERG